MAKIDQRLLEKRWSWLKEASTVGPVDYIEDIIDACDMGLVCVVVRVYEKDHTQGILVASGDAYAQDIPVAVCEELWDQLPSYQRPAVKLATWLLGLSESCDDETSVRVYPRTTIRSSAVAWWYQKYTEIAQDEWPDGIGATLIVFECDLDTLKLSVEVEKPDRVLN